MVGVTPDDVRAAHERIQKYVRRTPSFSDLDPRAPRHAELAFKLELVQYAGSFTARGAFHNLIARAVPPLGVAAASGSNHGIADAVAAQRLGYPARIFVPDISSPVKVAAIRDAGAHVVVGGAR